MTSRKLRIVAGAAAICATSLAGGAVALAATPPRHMARVQVRAHRATLLANGTATSKVSVRVGPGRWARHQAVSLATSGTCGALAATSGTTGRNGRFSTTYTASSTVGFCVVTATSGASSASVTITQIDPTLAAAGTHYSTTASASPSSVRADGTSTSTVTFTVRNGATPVASDPVAVVERALRAGACGGVTLGSTSTDGNGQDAITYTSSTSRGNCLLWVIEAATGSRSVVVIHQMATHH